MRVINPQRLNLYAYSINNPIAYSDPDGRDAVHVNLPFQAYGAGHCGSIVIRPDGSATYARFGPRKAGSPDGPGQVKSFGLTPVKFQGDSITDDSYRQLAQDVAKIEQQPAWTITMNYFPTEDDETTALSDWIVQMQALSDAGQAPWYRFNKQNCTVFCIAALLRANAIKNRNVSLFPLALANRLYFRSLEQWAWYGRTPTADPEGKQKKKKQPGCLKTRDGNCVNY